MGGRGLKRIFSEVLLHVKFAALTINNDRRPSNTVRVARGWRNFRGRPAVAATGLLLFCHRRTVVVVIAVAAAAAAAVVVGTAEKTLRRVDNDPDEPVAGGRVVCRAPACLVRSYRSRVPCPRRACLRHQLSPVRDPPARPIARRCTCPAPDE